MLALNLCSPAPPLCFNLLSSCGGTAVNHQVGPASLTFLIRQTHLLLPFLTSCLVICSPETQSTPGAARASTGALFPMKMFLSRNADGEERGKGRSPGWERTEARFRKNGRTGLFNGTAGYKHQKL